jgi:hypothetical protein
MSEKKIKQIKRLYYETTKKTIEEDLGKAVAILKTFANDRERSKAAVYLDGLSQMRSEWRTKKK